MTLKRLERNLAATKTLSPDQRIEYMELLENYEQRLIDLRDKLAEIPDEEPLGGKPNPRDEFVDGLMARRK